MEQNYKNSLLYRWTTDFVGSAGSFAFIAAAAVIGGFCYTFGLVPSAFLLLIFGVVLPVILTLCLYGYLLHCQVPFMGIKLFALFKVSRRSIFMRMVDCLLIMVLAALIYFDLLNYLFFRLLQTIFIPVVLLLALRSVFILTSGNEPNA